MVTTREMLEAMRTNCSASGLHVQVGIDACETKTVMDEVMQLIVIERHRQVAKWGKQAHTDGLWLLILTEELGEASKELLAGNYLFGAEELIQSAAVIIAWIENMLEAQNMDIKLLSEPIADGAGTVQVGTKER